MRCRDNFLPMVVARRCERQYQAWWYCVYPADLPARYGLPYPFFFQVDDIEYFIRTKLTDVIHLNGIFVRHESFHLKRTNAKNFYSFRNLFIFSELYPSMRLPIYVRIARDMLFSVMSFNYRNFTALRTAADSFLEGPEQMRRPGIYDELSAEAQLSNDEVVDITRYAGCRTYTGHPPKLPLWRKAVMALTLNGHFLPAFCLEECAIVGREGQYRELAVIYLKKTLCYETDSPGYGIVRTCSLQALFRETILLVPILLRFIRKRGEVGTRYRGMHREMTGTAWMQKQKHLKHTDNI
jgi:hypothetical protein